MDTNEWRTRESCVICGAKNFEPIFSFDSFPVFLACVDTPREQDVMSKMAFDGCSECGCIQLRNLVPLSILYGTAHADAPGELWESHYKEYAAFISKNSSGSVLEIGGGNGIVAELCVQSDKFKDWNILEPAIQKNKFTDPRINFEEGWFDSEYVAAKKFDALVFSHVMEHVYEPVDILKAVFKNCNTEGKLFISFPDMKATIKNGNLNVLHFEHTYYADEILLEYAAALAGFRLADKYHYREHSIFFAFEPSTKAPPATPRMFDENKKLIGDYMDAVKKDIASVQEKLATRAGPVYLCPASIFAQMFLACGMDTNLIDGLIDNSPLKVGRRLYGTALQTYAPEVLRGLEKPRLIMRAGGYNKEIQKQIAADINKETEYL